MPDGRERRELDWLVAASPLVVLEAIGEAVIVTDPAESIVFWNSAAEAMFGWSAPEVAGRNVAEVMAPGATTSQAAVMMAWVRTDERWMGDIQAVHRDGRSVTARVTAAPVFTDDGSLVGIVGLLRDVTEMRGTTAELAISKRRFQALIQGSGDLFAITDAEGVITFLDGPVQSLLGVEANTLVGKSLFEVLQPGDLNRAHARWAQQVATTTPMPPSDYWVRPGGGPWLCLNLLVSNLLDDPAVGGVVVTARDVTDHRHLEQARATMRGANIAIVHAASEDDLLGAICKVIVDETPYHVAWVGLSQPNLPLGARVVAFGDSPAYFDALERLAGKGTYRARCSWP